MLCGAALGVAAEDAAAEDAAVRPSGPKASADDDVVDAAGTAGVLFKNNVDREEESQPERQQADVAAENLSTS